MKRIFLGIPVILVFLFFIIAGGQKSEPVKIGLLIQDNKSVEAMQGAELALLKANSHGGYKGRKFELVHRSMEGPWGTGSKQAVDMIFNHSVIAIIGSHDGRNAHLVEQATTKSHVTFLSAWAGDPTLSQAFTPWFFNCVPNDNLQADILIEEIKKKKFMKITIVADDDYDANSAFENFVRKSDEKGSVKPVTIIIDKSERDLSGTLQLIRKTDTDCLLLFTKPAVAVKIISKLNELKIAIPVYGPLYLLKEYSAIYSYPEVFQNLLLFSQGDWYLREKSSFASEYNEKFGSYPGAEASYAYDAMTIMIKAIKIADADRENVQKALMASDHTGATGNIKFDDKGNRVCPVSVTE